MNVGRKVALGALVALPLATMAVDAPEEPKIRLRGVLHVDGRWFGDESTPETADTWLLRRVRPTVEGTLGNIYNFRLTPDFAGGKTIILDAFVSVNLRPWATVTAGKFKVPVGLERLQSANDLRFIERGFPTSLVPNRDIGVQLGGDLAHGTVSYSVGYFNGVTDGGSSDGNPNPDVESDTAGDLAARVFFQPFLRADRPSLRGLGFGAGFTYVDVNGVAGTATLPSYRTPGQQIFFRYRDNDTYADGRRLRWSPQLHYYYENIGLLAEYAQVVQDVSRSLSPAATRSDTLHHHAWQTQFSWFITGEAETIKGFQPGSTFSPGKPGRGAFELVARYHELRLDDATFAGGADSFANPAGNAQRAQATGLGLNWYLNRNLKWSLDYEITRFKGGGAVAGADRPDEKALLTRVAFSF